MIVLKIVLFVSIGLFSGIVLTASVFAVAIQKEIEKIERDTNDLNEQNTIKIH